MLRRKVIWFAVLLSVSASGVNAQQAALSNSSITAEELNHVIEYATPPEQVADSIVILVPDVTMPLDSPKSFERTISGQVRTIEKGAHPSVIVHPANSLILPTRAGVPMRVYLKRFIDRDAYYPIAIFPVTDK